MSEAKQRCQLDGCNRAASTRCFCCDKNVCTRHFSEHIDAIKAQIDPLANDVNTMVEKIQGLTIERITEPAYSQLQQWKMNMHQLVDEIFLNKTKEIEDIIEKNRSKFDEHKKQQFDIIMKVQDEVRQLAEDGDATYEQIQLLKTKMATVEINLTSFQKDFITVNTKVLAQGLVTISKSSCSKLTSTPITSIPTTTSSGPTAPCSPPLFTFATTTIPSNSRSGPSTVTTTASPFNINTPTYFGTTTAPSTGLFGTAPTISTTASPFSSTGFGVFSTPTATTVASSTGLFGTSTTATTAQFPSFSFGASSTPATTSIFVPTSTILSFQPANNSTGFGTTPSSNKSKVRDLQKN